MSKVHITLVGSQPAPVYNGVIATMPHKVVYIYSDNSYSNNALSKLLAEIPLLSEKILLDVTSPTEIRDCAEKLANRFINDEVTVNITSGLKSWSHWFGVVFDKFDNAAVIYMDQNNILWNYKTMDKTSDFEFDMHVLFRLYGNSLENNYTPFTEYTAEDLTVISSVEKIRLHNIRDFNKLTTILTKKQQQNLKEKSGIFEDGNSYVKWDKNLCRVEICFKNDNNKKEYKHILHSPHVMELVFNAGWFEAKVASMLSGWKYAKEICLNCKFPFKKNQDKNEVDIIVNVGNKILFVECKTQIFNTTDIDKFRSVIKAYGGTGSKGIFITYHQMSEMAKAKCEEHGILNFSLKDQHLGLEVDKALFLLLEIELDKINA